MNGNENAGGDDRWERDALRQLAQAAIDEQRRARRWRIFLRLLTLALITALVVVVMSDRPQLHTLADDGDAEHVALVKLEGLIIEDAPASADSVIETLEAAFENEHSKAVVLRVNSIGGSPVQSAQINDAIRRLRKQHPDKPVYAVITDVCASGAYYAAVAADAIYSDASSIVGSIGVIASGFGFVEAIEELGIERRVLKAGRLKDMLDPFLPQDEEAVAHLQTALDDVHRRFIERVREGRGDRLSDDPDLFSGLVWSGERAHRLGLTDGIGDVGYVAREIVGVEEIVAYEPPETLIIAFTREFGARVAHALLGHLALPALR